MRCFSGVTRLLLPTRFSHSARFMMANIPNPKIVALLEKATSLEEEDVQIVRLYKEIKDEAKKDNLYYRRRFHWRKVCCSWWNRGGFGCSGQQAVKTIDIVDGVGHDWDACKDSTVIEDPMHEHEEWFLREIIANDDMLPDYRPGDTEVASVGGTHYTMGLGMIELRRNVSHTGLCERITTDGRLSKEKVVARYPEMEDVIDNGLEYDVWKANSVKLYPDLPDVAQRALNAKHVAQQDEGAFQIYQSRLAPSL